MDARGVCEPLVGIASSCSRIAGIDCGSDADDLRLHLMLGAGDAALAIWLELEADARLWPAGPGVMVDELELVFECLSDAAAFSSSSSLQSETFAFVPVFSERLDCAFLWRKWKKPFFSRRPESSDSFSPLPDVLPAAVGPADAAEGVEVEIERKRSVCDIEKAIFSRLPFRLSFSFFTTSFFFSSSFGGAGSSVRECSCLNHRVQ